MAHSVDWDEVITLLQKGSTYKQIASTHNVNANTFISWCKQRDIKKREVQSQFLVDEVTAASQEVGPEYGRRMLNGYIKSKGIHIGERKTLQLMHHTSPQAVEQRRAGVRMRNPLPYHCTHYGQKLHFDQNEKLLQFGVFHAACIDGFSSKIIKHIVLHQKNPILLYEKLFRDIVEQQGVWDSVRVDYGMEWCVVLYAQHLLSDYRMNTAKPPYSQTYSKKNLRIERWWVEVNRRVNYPIKKILLEMSEQGVLPTDNDDRAAVEEFVRRLVSVGVERLVSAWNSHRIDRRGIPAAAPSLIGQVPANAVLPPEEIVRRYQENGGHLTMPSSGVLITDDILRVARDRAFGDSRGSFEALYTKIISGDEQCFKDSLLFYVHLCKQYKPV